MLNDYTSRINSMFQLDADLVSADELADAINLAVEQYSTDRPREVVEDVIAEWTDELPLPVRWAAMFSRLQAVEYPVGDKPPTLLDLEYLYEYRSPTGESINHVSDVFAIGGAVRLTYTAKHQLTDTVDSIPVEHREAVSNLAAALLCDGLAVRFSTDTDSTISADSVNHESKSRNFAARAKALRARYVELLAGQAAAEGRVKPASAIVDLDMATQRGHDRFYHPGRWR